MSTFTRRFSAVALFLALVFTPDTHAQLGVAAGLNFDRLGDISTQSGSSTFDNATGFHVGVFFDLGSAPISIRPGIFLRNAGDVEWNVTGVTDTFGLTMIEIPIDVRVPLLHAPLLKPYVLAGPVVSFPRSDNEDIEGAFEDLLLSASVGVGVEVSVPIAGLRLYPELRYAFGVSRFMKEAFTVGGVEFDVEDSTRLNAVMLRLGVGL